ncbi:hypothetical protein NQU17_02430 [Clostridiaceae bacterium HFYG-1003]|nr:hypothetical protein NQU17_02430 [Clostridiaceae bacterium HFYG-1003]
MELKQAIEYLVNLGFEEKKTFTDASNNVYVSKEFSRVLPDRPEAIKTSTLTSVIEYIKTNIDTDSQKIIHVEDYDTVSVYGTLDKFQRRDHWLKAKAMVPSTINYGSYYDTESFNIALQARFVPTEDRDTLLKISGCIEESAIKTSVDDGVSQSVAIRTGITTIANMSVPKTVKLKPFRTFTELSQPESEFVFRIKEGPSCALFEADGGAWKNQCILDIASFLEDKLQGFGGFIILA